MPRIKEYIDTDVLTEARKRVRHIFDVFDSVVVMFSGGKDSLAILHLVKEVVEERGLGKVNVVFRDEEFIPYEVVDFVNEYRQLTWINMIWYCVPLKSSKFILNSSTEYVQWDPSREWVRPKPPWAVTLADGDSRVFDQYTMDGLVARLFKGKIAFLTGVRASESLIRYRASVNKLGRENYINNPVTYGKAKAPKSLKICKPIFDWEEDDVFKYFMDHDIRYCRVYDNQLWGGQGLRVSSALHDESAKRLGKLRETAPDLYQDIMRIFPEMAIQDRYYRDLDRASLIEEYGQDWDGVKRWIRENLTDKPKRKLAMTRYRAVRARAEITPESYPTEYVLKAFMTGAYKREILPVGGKAR